ncbi:MAG: hypothetical protein LC650_01385 [Actinobacteria bacterium]|nr:hypothetical protein [Actinomycetota bacterium]
MKTLDTCTLKNGDTWVLTTRKNKNIPQLSEGPTWDIIATNQTTKEKLVFGGVLWYTEGWSQGSGRSEHGYYLSMRGYGSLGNGHGQKSRTKPLLSQGMCNEVGRWASVTRVRF